MEEARSRGLLQCPSQEESGSSVLHCDQKPMGNHLVFLNLEPLRKTYSTPQLCCTSGATAFEIQHYFRCPDLPHCMGAATDCVFLLYISGILHGYNRDDKKLAEYATASWGGGGGGGWKQEK